jgi:hypothetical protein
VASDQLRLLPPRGLPTVRLSAAAADDGADPHSAVTFAYPEELSRWQPLVKWLLAVPHYLAIVVLMIAAVFVAIAAFFVVVITGEYPEGARNFVVGVYRWNLRVQAYVGLLTDQYPPFTQSASA